MKMPMLRSRENHIQSMGKLFCHLCADYFVMNMQSVL